MNLRRMPSSVISGIAAAILLAGCANGSPQIGQSRAAISIQSSRGAQSSQRSHAAGAGSRATSTTPGTARAVAAAGSAAVGSTSASPGQTVTGPGVERYPWGTAIPMSVTGPSWFDTDLYHRVVAAGTRGVPLDSIQALKGGGGSGKSNGAGSCLGSGGAGPTSGTVPSTPNGVERPPVGLGPGTWLISLFCANVGGVPVPDGFAWCTANFVFQNGSSFGLGTAGHCAAKDALASPVTAIVTPPPEVCADGGSCAPGLYAIGTFSIVHNNGLGDDFAMISVYPQFNSWMRPTMPVFGGPTGGYTGGLAGVAAQTLGAGGNSVLLPAYSPAVVAHCGNGAVVGTGDTCRTSAGLFAASTWYAWYGPSTPGDSGSGVEILGNYSSPLNAVPAVADLTHIIILDASVSGKGTVTEGPDQPGMIGGTQWSKILSMIGGWTLVTGLP